MKLEGMRAAGWVRDLDVELVRRLEGAFGRPEGEDEDVRVLLALASAATGAGNVCLPLEETELEATLERRAEEEGLNEKKGVLEAAKAGAEKLGESGLAGAPGEGRPFVVEGKRLYLRRYWRYEEETASALLKLAADSAADVDAAEVETEIETETAGTDLTDEQKEALRGAPGDGQDDRGGSSFDHPDEAGRNEGGGGGPDGKGGGPPEGKPRPEDGGEQCRGGGGQDRGPLAGLAAGAVFQA